MLKRKVLLVFLIGFLSLSILSLVFAAAWNNAEVWTFNLQTPTPPPPSFHIVETWSFYLHSSSASLWHGVENWTFTLSGTASFHVSENWTFNLISGNYQFCENWTMTLNATPSFMFGESWTFTLDTTYVTPTPTVHTHYHLYSPTTILPNMRYHFGEEWIQCVRNDLTITSWYETGIAGFEWLNFTYNSGTVAGLQIIPEFYTAAVPEGWFFSNGVNYTLNTYYPGHGSINNGFGYWEAYWEDTNPCNISIPFPPGAWYMTLTVWAYDENGTSIAGSCTIGNATDTVTLTTPFDVAIEPGVNYSLTANPISDYAFNNWTYTTFIPGVWGSVNYTTIYMTLIQDEVVNMYYTYTPYNAMPLPIMFMMGMVGLASLIIGPFMGIRKFRQHDYRTGFILAVVVTAIGFALFVAWLWSI